MSKPMSEDWSCSACTYLNDAHLHRCAACDTANEGSGWSCPQCTAWAEATPARRCDVCGYKLEHTTNKTEVIQVNDEDDNDSGFGDDDNDGGDDEDWGDAVEDDGIDQVELPSVKTPTVQTQKQLTQTTTTNKAVAATTTASSTESQLTRLYDQFEKISILYRDHVQNADEQKDDNNDESEQRKRQKAADEQPLAKHKAFIHLTIQTLYESLPKQNAQTTMNDKQKTPSKTKSLSTTPSKQCSVCYSTFSTGKPNTKRTLSGDECWPVLMLNCGHSSICHTCFTQHLHHRIADSRVLPWLVCPHEGCVTYVDPINITGGSQLTLEDLIRFTHTVMSKQLRQSQYFIECQQSKCSFGFISFNLKIHENKKCLLCQTNQIISFTQQKELLDIEFKNMIEKGILRDCPQCHFYTLKEKGICNIINCNKCGIWWNWRTREIGTNERNLKEMARKSHTLWENGELQYQMNLEYSNPEEFKKLLERNGMKYDPNYIRGSGR